MKLEAYPGGGFTVTELSRPEESELIEQAKSGSIPARRTLIEYMMRVIIKETAPYRDPGNVLDLIHAGVCGLHRALELFDVSLGYPFASYAKWWIRKWIRTEFQRGHQAMTISLSDLDESQFSSDPYVTSQANKKRLAYYLLNHANLDATERKVLVQHFGLGSRAMSLREIGAVLGKSYESVRRIEGKALQKMHMFATCVDKVF